MNRIVICGTIRNPSENFVYNVRKLIRCCANNSLVKLVFVCSDSHASSFKYIERVKRISEAVSVINLGDIEKSYKSRTTRIAYCRNIYLQEIRKICNSLDVDYVIVSDLDALIDALNSNSINNALDYLNSGSADALTANQSDFYYDLWALRHSTWCPDDCWVQYNSLLVDFDRFYSHYLSIESRMLHISQSNQPISVESAFGGLAIYRTSCLLSSDYEGYQDGRIICEHVPMSQKFVKSGGVIKIFPSLINYHRTEHSFNAKMFKYLGYSNSEVKYD